jgi:hypothetical protein
MTGTLVARVVIDPAFTKLPGSTRYRITLRCGCTWWEEHPAGAAAPDISERKCRWHPVVADSAGPVLQS